MDKIRSNHSRYQSHLSITNRSKKYDPSKDTIYFEEEDDFGVDSNLDEKIPEYQLAEMQRRKKHFDEFKKMYNNKLEEKEARKRAEEEEKHDAFLQHPISKLLSKYGFQIPKSNKPSNNSLNYRNHPYDYKRCVSRSSRSGSSTSSRTRIHYRDGINDIGFSDMEIVDIYQRNMESGLMDKPMQSEDDVSTYSTAKDQNIKLRGDIAELEERFNTILQAFQTSPLQCRLVSNNNSNNNNNNNSRSYEDYKENRD